MYSIFLMLEVRVSLNQMWLQTHLKPFFQILVRKVALATIS